MKKAKNQTNQMTIPQYLENLNQRYQLGNATEGWRILKDKEEYYW